MYHPLILALVSLLTATRTTLAQQTPLQCHDPVMTRWMLNSAGETPCQVLQEVMQICNPSYTVDWLTPSYSCDNSPTSITAACCCGSPTFALFSACWSCQYNYTMDIVSTSFTSFEKDCSYIPAPLNEYDPIIRSQTEQVNIPLWAEMIPSAGRWDLAAAFRNATPDIPTASPPIPTNYPAATGSTSLSAGAIVGIIVGSVFGTSLMFIAAALILWGTLGPGCRRRKKDDDIRVGEHMGYLDGEYIYVRPETIPDIIGPNGHRYTLRRESNHLQPDLGGVSDYSSRGPSEYEDDTFGAVRPLRSQSRTDSRTLSYAPTRSPTHIDSPDLYSPARHASQDGRYTGFHPGESPLVRDDPRYRSSRDGYGFEERPRRPISGNYSQHTRPSGDYRQSRERPRSGHFVSRPVSGQFNARPRSGQFGSRPTSGQFDFYQVPVDFDTPPAARPPSTRRPVSAQFSTRPPSRSGPFEFYEVPGEMASPTPAPMGSRPVSGQYSIRPRGSTERKRDQRTSVRSSFRHASVDSTRRSGDGGGRFIRLAEGRRASVDGRVSQEKGRFSREEGRFSKEEPRFNKEDGWGRRSREAGRRSRDLYRKASLSEGDEDRERQGGNEGDEEESTDAPRPSGVTESSIGAPTRRSDATASGVGRQVHQQHLRQRSQSARTSCEIDMVIQDYDAESTPMPLTTSTSGPPTSNSHPSGAPHKPPRSPLRVVNPQHSDSDRDQHRPNSNLRPQPSLLARARGLLSARSSRSNISAGNRSSNRSSSIDGGGGGGGAPVPPSAWQQRLPNLLLRNRSGSTDLGRGRSEDSAHGSDVTSVYFSAVGHANPTPATTPGSASASASASREGPSPAAPADDASYQQEVDAGVQLIVESSPTTQSPESHESGPPDYLESIPDEIHASGAAPDTHLRVEPNPNPNPNRMSTLTQDTTVSVDWDSTMSSGVIQTWEAARRPTGFVGMGRVLSPTEPNAQHSQVSLSTAVSNLSDSEDGARLLPANRVE